MKRAVVASREPWHWLDQLNGYSIMVINPDSPADRYDYLLQNSDYSLLITDTEEKTRQGGDYGDERVYLYTSGTTGDSKFYGFSQQKLDTICDTMIKSYEVTSQDRYYGIMPFWHAHGQTWYWAARRAGCETKFGSIKDKSEIEQFQPTFLTSIPDMMPVIMRWKLQGLRFVRTASSAMPHRLFKELSQRFQVPVIEAFGMTEAISHCFTNPLHGEQRIGTVGLPDGIEFRLDQQQHLWIRGPATYYSDWFDTGDLAEQDDRGYVRILGRSIDQINVKGYKINPLSIEQKIMKRWPQIEEVAVFGVDRLKCVIKGNINLVDLRKFLVDLNPHCRPSVLQHVEMIPRTSQGKISRSMLQDLF